MNLRSSRNSQLRSMAIVRPLADKTQHNHRVKCANDIMKIARKHFYSIQNNSQIILFYLAIETFITFKRTNNGF